MTDGGDGADVTEAPNGADVTDATEVTAVTEVTDVTDIIDHRVEAALRAPYARILRREEDGGYSCEVLEFPGCYSSGGSAEQAMSQLDEAMALWVESEIEAGNAIPPPLDLDQHSGRLTLRIPPSLHERAVTRAAAERVSLNRLLSSAIASHLGVADGVTDGAGAGVDGSRGEPRSAVLRIAEDDAAYEASAVVDPTIGTATIRELARRVLRELGEPEA